MHGRRDLAWRLLDAYLQRTGDYAAVPVLRYYFVYRAMVRAKIEAIRAAQQEDAEAREGWMRCSRYLRLAARETRTAHPGLVLMHGLSGSGKSTVSQGLLEHARLIRVRTDVERRRLQDARDTPSAGIATGAYAPRMDRITYLNAAAIACVALRAGHGVIVDGAFLQRWQRDLLRGIARRLQVPCCIVHCAAPAPVLQARIEARRAAQSDASEATAAVLAHQQRHADPLDDAEWAAAITVASAHAAPALWPRVRRLLRRLRQDSSK